MIRATRDLSWLTKQTGVGFTPDARGIEEVRGGKTVGIVGFDHWGHVSAHIHVATRSAVGCRELAREVFRYAFGPGGREVLIAIVAASNHACLRLVTFFGFKQKHIIRDGWAKGVDFILFEMRKTDCRWLPAEVIR